MNQEISAADEHVRMTVIEALQEQFGLDAVEVDVMVKNGIVKLTGAVEDRPLLEPVIELVRNCEGVRDVESYMTVGPNQIDKTQAADTLRRGDLGRDRYHTT